MRFELRTEEHDERNIYITGNFNSWNPKDEQYKLHQTDPRTYCIEIGDEFLPDFIEYKSFEYLFDYNSKLK